MHFSWKMCGVHLSMKIFHISWQIFWKIRVFRVLLGYLRSMIRSQYILAKNQMATYFWFLYCYAKFVYTFFDGILFNQCKIKSTEIFVELIPKLPDIVLVQTGALFLYNKHYNSCKCQLACFFSVLQLEPTGNAKWKRT